MKTKPLVIAISLAVNIALIVFLAPKPHHTQVAATGRSAQASHQQPEHISADKTAWTNLNAEDDTTFLALLKAEGFPLRVQRILLQLRLRERYAAQFRALANKDREIPYWRTEPWAFDFNPETRAKRRALESEISNQIKRLLGTDDLREPGDPGYENRNRLYGSISSDKISSIEAITRDYNELASQIREAAKGVSLPEDREKLAFLEKEKRSDLVQLLSPEELDEYDRRNSPAASGIRNRTRYFDLTEKEFVALYKIQQNFDQNYGRDNLSGVQADRRRDAETELNNQFGAALGAERFADFQIMTDGNYSATRGFVIQSALPPDTAKDVVRLQRDLTRQAADVRNNRSLTAEQQAAQLTTIEQTANEKLTHILGTENFTQYKKFSTGQWITRLSPAAKTTPAR